MGLQRAPKAEIEYEVVRKLTAADEVYEERALRPQRILRLSSRHHALARYIGAGYKIADACILTGYSSVTVSNLQTDPTFQELIQHYSSMNEDKVRDLHEKMTDIAFEAADILQDRLEEKREEITIGQAIEISKLYLDRTGYGPQTKTETNVNVNIATRLNAARKRMKLIEETPNAD